MVKDPLQTVKDYFRFCPGDERIKISNAVCFGRRRTNFPKCRGCQFNDDEKRAETMMKPMPITSAPASPGVGEPPSETVRRPASDTIERPQRDLTDKSGRDNVETLFKSYDIRGTYPDPLNADAAWRIGYAASQFLRSELRGYDRSIPEKGTVVVGRDMRKSSMELSNAVIEGLRAGGSPVIDIGMVDTPQLYYAMNQLTACGGVQVTASHNAGHYNGFKICGLKAKPVSMETGLGKMLKIVQNTIKQQKAQAPLPRPENMNGPYKAFVRRFLKSPGGVFNSSRPLRVVVDASNGMAGHSFPLVFGDVDWIEVTPLNFEHKGEFVHDPNPLVEKNLTQLCDRVIRTQAQLGVCFDGDGDRCIFIDHDGQIVRSDLLTALLVPTFLKESAGSAVVYDLRCSRVVPEEIRRFGGSPRRERCGHSYIKKALSDSKGIFGGELSGHFYFRDNFFCDSALIAFAYVVNLLVETDSTLADLIAPLRRYAHSGEHNFHHDRPQQVVSALASCYAKGDIDYLDGITVQFPDWWFNVRPSNTEPLIRLNVEARDEASMNARLQELYPLLGKPVE